MKSFLLIVLSLLAVFKMFFHFSDFVGSKKVKPVFYKKSKLIIINQNKITFAGSMI